MKKDNSNRRRKREILTQRKRWVSEVKVQTTNKHNNGSTNTNIYINDFLRNKNKYKVKFEQKG